MVSVSLFDGVFSEVKTESIAIFIGKDQSIPKDLAAVISAAMPSWQKHLKQLDFSGQSGRIVVLPIEHNKKVISVVLVGTGDQAKSVGRGLEQVRRATGTLIKTLQAKKIKNCTLMLPPSTHFKTKAPEMVKQVTLTAQMALYHFDEYITEKSRKTEKKIDLALAVKSGAKKELDAAIKEADIVAESVNQTRHWIDLPPSALTPTDLANKAKAIAKKHGLGITVFGEAEVKKMGMGGLAGVSAGSEQDCKFVIMEYKAKKKTAPTLAFVGKGITFDSGGLSLKPADYMETMKEDMSGAAVVISTMQALAQLKPNVNVVGITPLSENLPSGKATKPGDILTFYNGVTAEVKNTDAEGRLILADALAYATKHYKPDAMIDLATLTGACPYALGPFFSGMMGDHDDLIKKVEQSADRSGDRVWRLPFDPDFKPAIVSDVADIQNIGKRAYLAGTITAGMFLQYFVGDTPWVHLDIAGTAFNVPGISYYRPGATGVGVRLLVDFVQNWK